MLLPLWSVLQPKQCCRGLDEIFVSFVVVFRTWLMVYATSVHGSCILTIKPFFVCVYICACVCISLAVFSPCRHCIRPCVVPSEGANILQHCHIAVARR